MIKAEEHLGLVAKLALRYARLKKNERIEDTEEFSDGMVGLAQAIKKFKPELGFQFSTYAFYCIRNSIWSGINRRRPHEVGFIPMSVWKNNCEMIDLDSYEDPEYIDDTIRYLYQFITLRQCDSPSVIRKKTILHSIFFNNRTLKDIGEEIGLTKERVRQLKEVALNDLRKQFLELY